VPRIRPEFEAKSIASRISLIRFVPSGQTRFGPVRLAR
jgi:hypothetical protein